MRGGHTSWSFDATDPEAVRAARAEGATGAISLDELVERLAPPRAVWVMVPAGAPTEQVVTELGERLAPGDVIIDGGNSYFKDDVRRAATLAEPRASPTSTSARAAASGGSSAATA